MMAVVLPLLLNNFFIVVTEVYRIIAKVKSGAGKK